MLKKYIIKFNMALLPLCSGTIRLTATTSRAVANRNGTGTIYPLFIANTQSGSRIDRITANNFTNDGVSSGSSYAVRLYITSVTGSNPRLFREQIMGGAYTPTGGAIGEFVQFTFPSGLVLGTNSSVYCGQGTYAGTNQITHWLCEGSDFE